MSNILLRDMDCLRRLVWLYPLTGTFEEQLVDAKTAHRAVRLGFAQQVRKLDFGKVWSAVYEDERGVVLQIGKYCWPLYDADVSLCRCSLANVVARIQIIIGNNLDFSMWYVAGGANPLNVLEAPRGLEEYDFFLWVSNMASEPEWCEAQLWRDGFTV